VAAACPAWFAAQIVNSKAQDQRRLDGGVRIQLLPECVPERGEFI